MGTECTEMLRLSSLTSELNDEQNNIIADLVTCRNLDDAEVLIREGDVSNELYLIVSGSLAVTRETGDGKWISLHLLRASDMAGELGFIDDLPHSATLRAIGPTQVVSLSRDKLEGLINSHPKIVYLVMRAIVREVHGILRRMNFQHIELTNYITKENGRY